MTIGKTHVRSEFCLKVHQSAIDCELNVNELIIYNHIYVCIYVCIHIYIKETAFKQNPCKTVLCTEWQNIVRKKLVKPIMFQN